MLQKLKNLTSWHIFLIILTVVTFFIYLATSAGRTPYDYFTRLGTAFLQGKYYLTDNPPWLNELIPIGTNKFAVVYPPAPAIVAIPFLLILNQNFQQQILAHIMGALAAFIWALIAYKKTSNKLTSLWVFLLTAFGNILWFLASTGSVWYLGQVSAFLFLTLTIYESLNKKRWYLVVLYFGFAFLSRIQTILALPLILYLNKNYLKILLGLSFFGVFFALYNYLRFGSFFETGYGLIPGVLSEPWYKNGIFDLSYIWPNFKVMFFSTPILKNEFPYIAPSWAGLSIFITSPAFIYAFGAPLKSRTNLFAWVSIFLIAFVIFIHGGTGFTQFGYRYAVDFYPLVLLLIVNALGSKNPAWHHWLLLGVSILVNLWGVLWINKFGWVSF